MFTNSFYSIVIVVNAISFYGIVIACLMSRTRKWGWEGSRMSTWTRGWLNKCAIESCAGNSKYWALKNTTVKTLWTHLQNTFRHPGRSNRINKENTYLIKCCMLRAQHNFSNFFLIPLARKRKFMTKSLLEKFSHENLY